MACGCLNGLRSVRRFPKRRRSSTPISPISRAARAILGRHSGFLGEKLHCSRRHVIRLVQELSTHRLITVTNVSNPERGHCANYYRFLWHPWMQTERDASFVLATVESEPLDSPEESAPDNCQAGATPGDIRVTSPLVTSRSPAPSDMAVTSPGDIHVTPLVTPMSPQENNKKRTNNRGKVPVTFSRTVTSKRA